MISLQKCIKLPISFRLPAMTGLHVGYTWRNLSYSSLKSTDMTMFLAVQIPVTIEWE